MHNISEQPRPEYPRPQFCREDWINLNGTWTYEFDFGKSGMDAGRQLFRSSGFEEKIIVPFCPESELSGVGYRDFIEAMWYHRVIEIPGSWSGKRIFLHFGGVDFECEAFVDGVSAGIHYGGTVSFCFDLTRFVSFGESHNLVIRVKDELRTDGQPRGKQCAEFASRGCSYTRTTGIWQTVWLEAVHPMGLKNCQILPDLDGNRFVVLPQYLSVKHGTRIRARLRNGWRETAVVEAPVVQGMPLTVSVNSPEPWEPENPFLYDLLLEIVSPDGLVVDSVSTYAGLRKVHIEGNRLILNNKPLYVRFVLDQGFYPQGIWTAPSDEALRQDIVLAMNAGFNGARLHQKVFEERFHYWADRLGYLTWGESASWGCDVNRPKDARNFLAEWHETVVRDRNHPSIIAWTPFNETRSVSDMNQHHRLHIDVYELTRSLDPTRPVNDASGYIHVRTDIWSVHHYERPDKLREVLDPGTEEGVYHRWPELEAPYEGQPYINDEFGGLKWIPESRCSDSDVSWGYGDPLLSDEEFYSVVDKEVNVMLGIESMNGYCYTQLTDVEQEQNGIYNYDRSEKFDMKKIRAIFQKTPDSMDESTSSSIP